jgi:DNA-binding transcriptional MerR regulator
MADAEVVLSPGDVARQLGVSPSGLRRLAVEYGRVHGELPKDSSGTSRLWSLEAVRRLERARALMAAGQARSIRDALAAVEGGAAPPVQVAAAGGDVVAALGVVATRLEAVLDSNQRLEAEVAALRAEVATLRALPEGERSPASGAAEVSADGTVVRLARWLEQRLRGRGGVR